MYPRYEEDWYSYPYGQEAYFSPSPYGSEFFYDPSYDERQFGPGVPPFSGPSQGFPGAQPPMGTPGQGSSSGPPTSPPPSYVPAQPMQAGTFAIDPGSIRRCLFRYTYIWLRNRQQFWFYPIFIGRNSVSGWRWTGFGWMFFGISLNQITSFTCV